ncbi:nucleotidyl transferase AbiEii/AbiGii toxin family protein [Schlesneria sp. DSM 10557]|uniref:nucleotidyl transferase AbiEii/AbiGii toxin family protein n=1 Tax=Schlesneria sp. DSM 10557 TaxID=3044399 RepID=UPI00359FBEAD
MSLFEILNRFLGRKNSSKQPNRPTHPATLRIELANPELNRPIVFDPALRQFTAHRAGEPAFESGLEADIWRSSRLAVLQHMLCVVRQSRWSPHLMLRGSALMVSWFGELARRPGDLDWVVLPAEWKAHGKESRRLIADLLEGIEGASIGDEILVPPDSHVMEDIWTYERASGIRIVVPWNHTNSKYNGSVQMDFVFQEEFPSEPLSTAVSVGDFPPVELLAVSPHQSLAWKLLWLTSDSYPMGKDLYDAVLLAEKFGASVDIIRETFRVAGAEPTQIEQIGVLSESIEWNEFLKEHPHVTGTAGEWQQRLTNSLDSVFKKR